MAGHFGVSIRRVWDHHVENPRKILHLTWRVGGRRLDEVWFGSFSSTAIVFWWFLQTYMTSGPCFSWFFLVMKSWFFWYYLGLKVKAGNACVVFWSTYSLRKTYKAVTLESHSHLFWAIAIINTLMIRSSLKDWQSMKRVHTCVAQCAVFVTKRSSVLRCIPKHHIPN